MALELPAGPLSYDDYAALDDGLRYQVIEGELVLTPSGTPRHQSVAQQLWMAIEVFARQNKLGTTFMAPLDVVLRAERPAVVLQPDVFFIQKTRRALVTKANIQGAPDLAIEVLSPSNARLDTLRKAPLYARYGVSELWIVSHETDRIDVLRLQPDGSYGRPEAFLPGDTLTTPLLPGFSLAITALFEASQTWGSEFGA